MPLSGARRAALSFRVVNRPGRPGFSPDLQRHHLLPRQLLSHRGLRHMAEELGPMRLGMHDFRRNGMLLPATEAGALRMGLPLHRGPHRHYSEMVLERVGQIERGWRRTRSVSAEAAAEEALMRLSLLQRSLRRRLLDPQRWPGPALNRRDPALDFAHLDRMADMLWIETETD